MKKILVFIADSNGGYPVPATKGGAVTTLIEHLIKENSHKGNFYLNIVSYYDKNAEELSKKYENLNMIWIKVPKFIEFLDKSFFSFFKKIFKKKKIISYKSIFSLFYYIFKSTFIIKKIENDVVILENNVLLSWIIRLSKYNKKFYYHFHNVPRFDAFNRDVFKKCNKYICVSKYVANKLNSEECAIGKIDSKKLEILYNCINVDDFYLLNNEKKMSFKHEKGFNKDDFILLFVGRLSKEKGVDKVIEAFKNINNDKLKLMIVGSVIHNIQFKDSYVNKLNEMIKDYKEKIIFTGYIPLNELVYYYNIADVAILPSMWEEPAGLTMLEAIACGIPLITTKSGGIPEYVSKHCILIDKENVVKNIEKSVIDIMNKNCLIDNEKGIELIKERYTPQVYYENFCKIIEEEL